MTAKTINVVQLFPEQMNIYGDDGNAQIICRRLEWYGYQPVLGRYDSTVDVDVLTGADIVLGGGGQDSGQRHILADLHHIKSELLDMAHDRKPMLMICGLYQLFGHYFRTVDGDHLDGIGLFDMETAAGNKRLIGNIIIRSDEFGDIVGYENHSGVTGLGENQMSLGQVISGHGNDGVSGTEGARRYAAIGTYMHGPVLSKNPQLADWLIARAAEVKFGTSELAPASDQASVNLRRIDDLAVRAAKIARTRPQ